MSDMDHLPWDVTAGTTVRTGGDNLHARATALAVSAMETVASQPVADVADTGYGRAQASYEARLAEMRSSSAQSHLAANNARAIEAAERKAERRARHEAVNAAAQAEAKRRRNDKAA